MDFPFLVKKIVAAFLYPCGFIFLFLFLAFWASLSRYRRGLTKFLIFLTLVTFYAFSTPWVPTYLLIPLERRYQEPSPQEIARAKAVVLLPGYVETLPGLKLRERPGPDTSRRLIAAVLVAKEYKLPLIVVGSPPKKKGATYLAKLAQKLGVRQVEAYNNAVDTKSSALVLKKRLAGKPFLLVTSACHMPRSVYLFRRAGLKPIPYPAYRSAGFGRELPYLFFPNPRNLLLARQAIHEYLGLAFYRLVDHISSLRK